MREREKGPTDRPARSTQKGIKDLINKSIKNIYPNMMDFSVYFRICSGTAIVLKEENDSCARPDAFREQTQKQKKTKNTKREIYSLIILFMTPVIHTANINHHQGYPETKVLWIMFTLK